jgi:hypothetical protein
MKGDNVYYLLITFVIFTLVQKVLSFTVERKFPTYHELNLASPFWRDLVKVRGAFQIISLLFTSYFLYNFKFMGAVKAIFIIMWIHSILYFLMDRRLIYLFTNKTEESEKIINFFDVYADMGSNILIALAGIYASYVIFAPK